MILVEGVESIALYTGFVVSNSVPPAYLRYFYAVTDFIQNVGVFCLHWFLDSPCFKVIDVVGTR